MTHHLILTITVISLCTLSCKASSSCNVQKYFLNGAMYMIAKTEYDSAAMPQDCSDLLHMGNTESGTYTVWPTSRLMDNKSLEVYCDMITEGGGWTVLQRRKYFDNEMEYFSKDWNNYKNGFGDLKNDFWLGNEHISALTNQRLYSVRFDLKNAEGKTLVVQYDTFWIDDENNKYRLHAAGYKRTADDSLKYPKKFSTKYKEKDILDEGNCANFFSGGWWQNDCLVSNLNGLYLDKKQGTYEKGLLWKNRKELFSATEIKIRPKHFKLR